MSEIIFITLPTRSFAHTPPIHWSSNSGRKAINKLIKKSGNGFKNHDKFPQRERERHKKIAKRMINTAPKATISEIN